MDSIGLSPLSFSRYVGTTSSTVLFYRCSSPAHSGQVLTLIN